MTVMLISSCPELQITVQTTWYSPGSSGACNSNSCTPSWCNRFQFATFAPSFARSSANPCTDPSRFMFLAFFAVITSLIGSPACSVIVGLALPSILYWLSLSARISIVRSLVCAASIADIVNSKPIKQMAIALNALLRHVREDQFHIFIGQHGANAHVANDGAHHAWRELVGSLVAASAIRAIPL